MTRRIVAWLVVVACGDPAAPPGSAPVARFAPGGPAAAQVGSAHGEPELIRIAPDMLRDLRVTTGVVQARAAGETVSALGELHVNEDAYAEVASPVTARVTRVVARPGDRVAAGQVLAQLYSAELEQARAELDAANDRLAIARAAAARKRALVTDRLVPERELLEAEAALSEAAAAERVATAALRRFGGGEAGLAIRSPIAGTVIERALVLGQLADPAKTVFRVGDLSTLWLVAHVYERDAVRIQIGRPATASFAALPGKASAAVIRSIGREVDAASRTIAIRLDVANPEGILRPGMSATAVMPLGELGAAPVIVAPAAALQRVGSAWVVFVPRGEAAFEARPVGRGRDLAGEVEVLSGVTAGEPIVVDGAFLLKAEADKARGGGEDR